MARMFGALRSPRPAAGKSSGVGRRDSGRMERPSHSLGSSPNPPENSIFRESDAIKQIAARHPDGLRLALVLITAGILASFHLSFPAAGIGQGFIFLAMAMPVFFRSSTTCAFANGGIAAIWAITWYVSHAPFTTSALLSHLAIAPFLSIALHRSYRKLEKRRATVLHKPDPQKAASPVGEEVLQKVESGLVRDDTPDSSAVQELRNQNHLLELIIATVPDEIFVRDLQHRVLVANSAFYNTLQLAPEQVLGKHVDEFLPEGLLAPSQQTDMQVLERGTCLKREAQLFEVEGQQRQYEINELPLLSGDQVVGIVAVCRDVTEAKNVITELHKKDELLREQVNRLRAFVENAPAAVAMFDREMRYLAYSRRWLLDYRLEGQSLTGWRHYDVFPGIPERLREIHQRVIETGVGEQCDEDSFQRIDGRDEWIRWEVQAWRDSEGEIGGLISFDEVITDRKKAEERFRRQEALLLHASRLSTTGELVAGIAHEINQPLFSILNYSKAVENIFHRSGPPDLESIRNWIQQIRNEATRGGQITQRLKSFAKRADTQRATANINEIVEESIGFISAEARSFGVQIHCNLAESLPSFFVDRVQIQQVLVNLIKNAIECLAEAHSVEGKVVVSTLAEKSGVAVTVADNGLGIPTDQDIDILEPFHTTKQDGVGLGLAISNSIIMSHNGSLTYETNEWGGATFRFTLFNTN